MNTKTFATLSILCLGLASQAADKFPWKAELSPERKEVLNHVRADSLKGHLWFIASDLL